jgi:hypothetical protein
LQRGSERAREGGEMSGVARRSMAEINGERMPTQLEVVRQVMLLAAQYGSWMTLEAAKLLRAYGARD